MALEEVLLPKEYKNARVLFEQNLDKWRVKAQQSFNVTNLNLSQIAKDCFLPGYDYDNDGQANYGQSLEARLNSVISGGAVLTGTAYPSWTINSTANSATMTTSILTAPRTYQFPDVSGTFLLNYATQPGNAIRVNQDVIAGGSPFLLQLVCGAHTSLAASTEASDLIFDLARTVTFATGPIVAQRAFRVSAPTYAFTAASTITDASTFYISGAPTAGANATFTNAYALLVAAGATRLGGNLQVSGNLDVSGTINADQNIFWKSSTAFTGSFDHTNTANRVYTFEDVTGKVLLDAAIQTVTAAKTFNTDTLLIPNSAPTVSRSIGLNSGVLQAHDGTSAKSYLRTDTYNEKILYVFPGISLGTGFDAAFIDVTGADITFTVNVPGRYSIIFTFTPSISPTNAAGQFNEIFFRLTDGTTNKSSHVCLFNTNLIASGNPNVGYIVTLFEVFNFTTSGSKTVKLQKKMNVGGAGAYIWFTDNATVVMKVIRIAD